MDLLSTTHRICGPMAFGGWSAIYKMDTDSSCYALKVARDAQSNIGIEQEKAILKKLWRGGDTPSSIIQCHGGYLLSNGLQAVVLDWHRENLSQRSQQENGLSLKSLENIADQMTKALSYLRAEGIVHRDIKPENILVSDSDPDRVILCDFGLAKQGERRVYQSGTFHYIPPEELLNLKTEGYEGDLWALGASLAEIALGEGIPLFPYCDLIGFGENESLITFHEKILDEDYPDNLIDKVSEKAMLGYANSCWKVFKECYEGERVLQLYVPLEEALKVKFSKEDVAKLYPLIKRMLTFDPSNRCILD